MSGWGDLNIRSDPVRQAPLSCPLCRRADRGHTGQLNGLGWASGFISPQGILLASSLFTEEPWKGTTTAQDIRARPGDGGAPEGSLGCQQLRAGRGP